MGGDYVFVFGIVLGMVVFVNFVGWFLFVLWLDVYSDFYIMEMIDSGNLYGMFVVYFMGCDGFEGFLKVEVFVFVKNICMIGLWLVDLVECVVLVEMDM